MTLPIIDTAEKTTRKLPQLKQAGVMTVIRYINPLNTRADKDVDAEEAHAIVANGMRLGLVCEGWGGAGPGGIGASINQTRGEQDAIVCRSYAANEVGAPAGACIYFAIDTDASSVEIQNFVLPYFRSVFRIMNDRTRQGPIYQVGVYGSGLVCQVVQTSGLAQLTWLSQSTGWRGYKDYKASMNWALLQHMPQQIAGLDTDPDEQNPAKNMGSFIPFGGESPPLPVLTGVFYIQDKLNKLLKINPPLILDGVVGPKTLGAIRTLLDQQERDTG